MLAYWIARVTVTDPDAYARYAERVPAAIGPFSGRMLARGGRSTTLEGTDRERTVIIEFPSFDRAVACYNSTAYQEAMDLQKGAAIRDLCIVEGV